MLIKGGMGKERDGQGAGGEGRWLWQQVREGGMDSEASRMPVTF